MIGTVRVFGPAPCSMSCFLHTSGALQARFRITSPGKRVGDLIYLHDEIQIDVMRQPRNTLNVTVE